MGNLHLSHPRLSDFEARARRRLPFFCAEYLLSGTGEDRGLARNAQALNAVTLTPRALSGDFVPKTQSHLFGQTYAYPFGVAPVGATGLIWPGGEAALAQMGKNYNLPYCLSTVAAQSPEAIGPLVEGFGWFQLYPLQNLDYRRDLVRRARDAGFKVLVLTVDVPTRSRRERQIKAGFTVPPKITPVMVWQAMKCPAWSLQFLRHGMPTFPSLTPYFEGMKHAEAYRAMAHELHGRPDWSIIADLKKHWDGPLVIKGILRPDDAMRALGEGADALWVSNHGARQIDAAPAPINRLPAIRAAVGDEAKLIVDSGISSGLDVARALALGADFVFAGRAFLLGLAAFGVRGGAHVAEIFADDLKNAMIQLGAKTTADLRLAL